MTKEKNVDEAMWSERRMREEAIERRVGGGKGLLEVLGRGQLRVLRVEYSGTFRR